MAAIHHFVAAVKRSLTPSQARVLDGVADALAPLLEKQEAEIYAERRQLAAKLATVGDRHSKTVERTAAAYAAALAATAKAKAALQLAAEHEQAAGAASYAASILAAQEENEIRAELVKTAPAIVIRANEEFHRFDLGELQPVVWFDSLPPRLSRWEREALEDSGGLPLERPVEFYAEYAHAIAVMQRVRAEAQALLYCPQTEAEAHEAVEGLFRRANEAILPLKGRPFEIGEGGQIKRGAGQRGVHLDPTPEEPAK